MSESRKLDYEEVMEYIGKFGKYQRRVFFWLWLLAAAGGLAVVVFSFTAFIPKHRVRTECDEGDSYYLEDGSLPEWIKPLEGDDFALMDKDCRIPEITRDESGKCIRATYTNTSKELDSNSLSELIFDDGIMTSSLVQTYSFLCGRADLRTLYNLIYMFGMLFGSYFMGFISDTYGRKTALMLAIVLVSVSGALGAVCIGPGGQEGYGFLRFITGVGGIGCFMVCFVLAVEHVGSKYTMFVGIAIEIPFALGEALIGVEAMIFRDWRVLQVVAYLPLIALLGLYWVLPESTRWLIANGKNEQARKQIKDASEMNGRQIPDYYYQEDAEKTKFVNEEKGETQGPARATILDLFRSKLMITRTVNMAFQWFSVTMCYYGLTFASSDISDDTYVNFILICLIEIPSYIFCILVMDMWGRRPILSFCQLLAGICCVTVGLLMESEGITALKVTLSLLGKFGASAAFAIVYVYTAELFPTVIRNQAVGVCSLVARIGGMLALALDLLKEFWLPAPVFIMGCIATIAGLFALLFPETLGQKLPETMEESARIGKDSNRKFCECTCFNPLDMFKEELREVEQPEKGKL